MATVRETTYDLLRSLGMTTIFGNPGSTEETFLAHFPSDFAYVLALQEASVVAMADGYAQATGHPAFVNLHSAPGTGNAMGNLVAAWHNKTPLIVTAGQQTRTMAVLEPWLTNRRAPELPQPYVKWSYEPLRAQDIPAALMRGYATAVQPPSGPVYLALPMDDWDEPALGSPAVRQVSTRVAPDPNRLQSFADALASSRNPALIMGAGIDRSGGWQAAVTLAEKLRASVWAPPASERAGFPEDHPQFQGTLPFAIGPLSDQLRGHDTVLVIGAPVFRYYPYVPGEYVPPGTHLFHITDDPDEAARAPVGDSLLADAGLACAALAALVPASDRPLPSPRAAPPPPRVGTPLSPAALFATLAREWPDDGILVEESPSNLAALHRYVQINRPASFFTMASGGLGYGLPAAMGIALAERHTGRGRPVIAVIGDGSFHYSVQALWTAAREQLPVVYVVPVNQEYDILKSFAELLDTPGVPGLDLPGLDVVAIARGYGCTAEHAPSAEAVADALRRAFRAAGPAVLSVPISREVPPLL
ncbi:MAG: benzoylformate decarboxylase [Ktedonobacterales bacterium]